ncbi:hypothetical protein BD309DRAFT_961241 [Dichomitus squalens]|nr:hypothetical protein BD309DRAFT_961241 [Dichomitus squalens]
MPESATIFQRCSLGVASLRSLCAVLCMRRCRRGFLGPMTLGSEQLWYVLARAIDRIIH